MNYKVSIIVPIYNSSMYLERCLDSLLQQTLHEIQIVAVNDGSTDNSLDILKNYKKNDIRFTIIQQKNQGVSSARNVGIKSAQAELVSFVDSDDTAEPDMLKSMYIQQVQEQSDIVYSQLKYLNENGDIVKSTVDYELNETRDTILKKMIAHKINPSVCIGLFKKSLFVDYNILFPSSRLHEDSAISYKMVYYANKISTINIPFYNYHLVKSSRSNSLTSAHFKDMYFNLANTKSFLIEKDILKKYGKEYYNKIDVCTNYLLKKISNNVLPEQEKFDFLLSLWCELDHFKDSGSVHVSKRINWVFVSMSIIKKIDIKQQKKLFPYYHLPYSVLDKLYQYCHTSLGVVENIIQQIDSIPDIKQIYIYGAGDILDRLLSPLKARDIVISGVIDQNKVTKKIDSKIMKAKKLEFTQFSNSQNYVVVASIAYAHDITLLLKDFINTRGVNIKIINFYEDLLNESTFK